MVLFSSHARALGRGLGAGKASVPRVNTAHYCITIQLLFLVYVFNATSDLTNSYLCELEKFANAFKRRWFVGVDTFSVGPIDVMP